MAFLRFSRDKRGYEHFYLVQPVTNRRGKSRTRVLYFYRTPPGVKVGREPFDPELRRALEAQNPDVQFDWKKIVETPIPSADVEKWRERRRAEKAAKLAARARREDDDAGQPDDAAVEADVDVAVADAPVEGTGGSTSADAAPDAGDAVAVAPAASASGATPTEGGRRRRRRRRGRRGRSAVPAGPGGATLEAGVSPDVQSADAASDAGDFEPTDSADDEGE